jgi:Ni,Fe-hydrogenase III component G
MSETEKVRKALEGKIVKWLEHSPRRIYITISPEDLKESVRIFHQDLGLRFSIATGTDTQADIEITYHFSSDGTGQFFSLRVHLKDKVNPEIDSISGIMKAGEWIEREIWELLGVNFKGHPDLRRLLLSEDWPQGVYPLRRCENKIKMGNPDG